MIRTLSDRVLRVSKPIKDYLHNIVMVYYMYSDVHNNFAYIMTNTLKIEPNTDFKSNLYHMILQDLTFVINVIC